MRQLLSISITQLIIMNTEYTHQLIVNIKHRNYVMLHRYFYEPVEKIDSLNFKEEMKMIDICALGPLRISAGLFNAGLLKSGSKVAMITSQGGAISWRTTQVRTIDYTALLVTECHGHHTQPSTQIDPYPYFFHDTRILRTIEPRRR